MTTDFEDNRVNPDVTFIDSANTTAYTTTGENRIRVDTSSAAVTITLATADATRDPEHKLRIYDDSGNASSNNITVDTGGGETIDPGGASSKTISVDNAQLVLEANGSNWTAVNRNQEAEQVTTVEGSITGETYIEASRGSASTGNATSAWVNAIDSEDEDNRGELNGSLQFSPDKDGKYSILGYVEFDSANDQDRLGWRLRNVTDGINTSLRARFTVSGTGSVLIPVIFRGSLNSAKTYEVQANNTTSTFAVGTLTDITIEWGSVQP